MNARNPNTINNIQDHYFRMATHMVATCVCTMTVAIHNEFGFGKERCARLLEQYKKINRHLNDYQDETKSDAELRTVMAEIGLQEFADQILQMHRVERYLREMNQMNKVSFKEAEEARRNLELMKKLL